MRVEGWQGGMHCNGDVRAEETATGAGGTHPTGMHSCFNMFVDK